MEIIIPETRGRKPKYDFTEMDIGTRRSFINTNVDRILTCAKSFCKTRGLSWRFRCYTINEEVFIVRIK